MKRAVGETNPAPSRDWPEISAAGIDYDGPRVQVTSTPNRATGSILVGAYSEMTVFLEFDPEAARLLAQDLNAAADDANRRSDNDDTYPEYLGLPR